MTTRKTWTAEQREGAALICAVAALSNSEPVESYFHISMEIEAEAGALDLATEAWCVIAQSWNGNTWSNEIHGEVESLIRSGWEPGDTITFGLSNHPEKLYAFGELEEPAVTDDHGITQTMAEIPRDADFFDGD